MNVLVTHYMLKSYIKMRQEAGEGQEASVWIFIPFWEQLCRQFGTTGLSVSFLFSDGFYTLLNMNASSRRFPHITEKNSFFVNDDDILALISGKMAEENLAVLQRRASDQGIKPDVVVSRMPSPWAEAIFPNAVHAVMEVGPVSRWPYPSTVFLDPYGYGRQSIVGRYPEKIKAAAEQLPDVLPQLREVFGSPILNNASRERKYIDELRTKFRKILLFAVQYPGFFYSPYTRFNDMAGILEDILKCAPDDVAIVFCARAHNYTDHGISAEMFQALKAGYANLVEVPETLMTSYYTQMMVPFADGVVAVTSTVGLQAPLWEKKWYTSPECYYREYTPSYAEIAETIDEPVEETALNLVNWMFQKYSLPMSVYSDARNMVQYVSAFTEMQDQAPAQENIFLRKDGPISIERLLEGYRQALNFKQGGSNMTEYVCRDYDGVVYNLHTNSLEDKALMGYRGELEPKIQYLFRRFVRQGDHVLDIGANSGFHTICLSKVVGETGVVHAFEPVPFNFRKLVTNLHLNGIQNVATHYCAAGSENCRQTMNVIREGEYEQGNHSLAANEKIEGILKEKIEPLEVDVKRLDDLFSHISRLDFIKIDVEGFEIEVLKGASALLKKFKPIIIMEWAEPRLRHLGIKRTDFASIFGDDYIFFEIRCDDEQDKKKVTALNPYSFDRAMSNGSWDLVCLPLDRFEYRADASSEGRADEV